MNGLINNIVSDKILRVGSIASSVFLTLALLIIVVVYRNLPPFIPIYNQMPWGEERLGSTPEIFIPLLIAFSVFLTNIIFAHFVYNRMPLISRTLCITSLLISLIMFIFVVRTIQLVY